MNSEIIIVLKAAFDKLIQRTSDGKIEYWFARDLMAQLGYDRWENFSKVVEKAKTACSTAEGVVEDHFRDATKMVDLGSGAKRQIDDIMLTRYACYLIAQNGDPRKEQIAFAQTYFARNNEPDNTLENVEISAKKGELVTFDAIKQADSEGWEYWKARELSSLLGYSEYRHFLPVIEKAKEACSKSGNHIADHFEDILDMVDIGSGAKRKVDDVRLSRYACYLIVQNGDPSKPVIANGQTYFAIQTRRQELADDVAFQQLREDERRLFLRNEMKEHNKQLVEAAQQAGVETNLDFALFQNHGYRGLYGGLDAKAIHKRKGLKKSQHILDNMGSTELAANLFRATQTEEKLVRENIQGKSNANATHYEVGKKVRQTIEELGGTMPENLPTPGEDLKKLERRVKSSEKKMIGDGFVGKEIVN